MYFCPVRIDFNSTDSIDFEQKALTLFSFQAAHCSVYADYIRYLGINPKSISCLEEIPFLPISFFKSHKVLSTQKDIETIFTSSGTTGMEQSKHYVANLELYEKSYLEAFKHFYGQAENYCILALLPSYQEREGSSLIYMVDDLISKSTHPKSGYFLYNHLELFETLKQLKEKGQATILIGVTYALLDFAAEYQINFPELIVMETGGMKGRRKEMIREEVHKVLKYAFSVKYIHSEYGMTELLSQAYSKGDGLFCCPPWMRVLIRDTSDPLSLLPENGKTGGINIIDLANENSCAFLATQDLGKLNADNTFEVIGRFDFSDVRGCNLLVQ